MEHWEHDLTSQGYEMFLVSTQVDENAQYFYRKLGYKDCGGLVINIPKYEQPMEMFMIKAGCNVGTQLLLAFMKHTSYNQMKNSNCGGR